MNIPKLREIACAILAFSNDLIGLQLRDNKVGIEHPGRVSFFGGNLEIDETYEQALHREIQEELNLKPNEYKHDFVGSFPHIDGFGASSIIHLYILKDLKIEALKILEGHLCLINSKEGIKNLDVIESINAPLSSALVKIKQGLSI